MKITTVKVLRTISKVVLVVTGLLLLGFIGYATYLSIRFKPYKVRVSNVTDSAFTVSWITDEPMTGVVYYGEKDNFLPGILSWIGKKKAFDDRDVSNAQTECISKFNEKVSKNRDENFTVDVSGYDCNDVKVRKRGTYYTHHVTIPNLESEKEYYFRVGNGFVSFKEGKTDGVEYIDREMPAISEFKHTTLPTFKDVSSPNPAYGTSFNVFYTSDGQIVEKKNFDSIVFLRTFKSGDPYPLMSAVTNSDGGWSIDLANVRKGDGSPLEMDEAFLEFIPQVDNAKPGASGTTKFEDLSFPLNLMGNNIDDLEKVDTSTKQLESKFRNLIQSVTAYDDYDDAISCWEIGSCKYKTFSGSCPSGYTSVKSQCQTSNPSPQPPPAATKLWCLQGSSSCYCVTAVQPPNERYTDKYSSKEACEGAIVQEPERLVSCCSQLGESDCVCVTGRQPGSCSGAYPKEFNTNNLNDAKAQCKASLPQVENNCYTYNETNNSCDGPKACKSGTLSYKECQDKRKEKLGVQGNKTCCKTTGVTRVGKNVKALCICNSNQTSCTGDFLEYSSKKACEGTSSSTEEGSNRVCKGQCKNGKQVYVVYKVGGGGGGRGNTNMMTFLDRLFATKLYAEGGEPEADDTPMYEFVSNDSCAQVSTSGGRTPEDLKDTCSEKNKDKCKKCYSKVDCSVIYKNSNEACSECFVDSYLDCGGEFDTSDTSVFNSSYVNRIEDCVQAGATKRIVSGGCGNNCYLQYKLSNGETCVNLKLKEGYAFCSNPYCPDDKARAELNSEDEVCESAWCMCPEGSKKNSVLRGGKCAEEKQEDTPSQETSATGGYCCYNAVGQLQERCVDGDNVRYLVDSSNNASTCLEAQWDNGDQKKIYQTLYCIKESVCEKTNNVDDDIEDENCYERERGLGSCNEALQSGNFSGFDNTYNLTKTLCKGCDKDVFYGYVVSTDSSQTDSAACIAKDGTIYEVETACQKKLEGYKLTRRRHIVYFQLRCDSQDGRCSYGDGINSKNYDCCKFSRGNYGVVPKPSNEDEVRCVVDDVPREVVSWSLCRLRPHFTFGLIYCAKRTDENKLNVVMYFIPSEKKGLDCPADAQKVYAEGTFKNQVVYNGAQYYCYDDGFIPYFKPWKTKAVEKCITDGGIHPDAYKVKGVSDTQVLGAQDGEQESESPLLYLPSEGIYSISESGNTVSILSDGETEVFFFSERNGIPGYQAPKDPNNPQDNEDILVSQSALILDVSQETSAKQYNLKEGINIISFDFFPSEGEEKQLMSNRFLELVNQTGDNVSRISYFGDGQWGGGNTYDFDTQEVKGSPFSLSQGRGYVVVAERDTTITVPGYETNTPIPIAFSSGWNLVGVHGHSKQYTARSLIESINSIEGLKSNNVTWWPTSKGMYQGYQFSDGQSYGQDFPISKDLGYFVRINKFEPKEQSCRSILWNPGGDNNGKCGTNN